MSKGIVAFKRMALGLALCCAAWFAQGAVCQAQVASGLGISDVSWSCTDYAGFPLYEPLRMNDVYGGSDYCPGYAPGKAIGTYKGLSVFGYGLGDGGTLTPDGFANTVIGYVLVYLGDEYVETSAFLDQWSPTFGADIPIAFDGNPVGYAGQTYWDWLYSTNIEYVILNLYGPNPQASTPSNVNITPQVAGPTGASYSGSGSDSTYTTLSGLNPGVSGPLGVLSGNSSDLTNVPN